MNADADVAIITYGGARPTDKCFADIVAVDDGIIDLLECAPIRRATIHQAMSSAQPILDHIAAVIRPALRNYLVAEKALMDALVSNVDAGTVGTTRQDVMLAARQAVDVLHHLSDFVFKEPSSGLVFAKIEDARSAVEARCVFLRTAKSAADVSLLRDIADAFKHHRPDRPSAAVLASTDVAPVSMGFGQARFGEGKFDGVEQVVITTKAGDMRALSSVLQNVFDAWMTLLGQRCRRSTSIRAPPRPRQSARRAKL